MSANTILLTVTPDANPVFRPFKDSDLNGMWLFDNEFPEWECKNERELRGYRQADHAAAEYAYTEQPGYAESRERSLR